MFEGQGWYMYLTESMRRLVDLAYYLLDREELSGQELYDYSFVVFPMAKIYEGFLKQYLCDINLIDEKDKASRHFRIGRSLNPSLPSKFRDDKWIYDDLVERTQRLKEKEERELPPRMWRAWRGGRNRVFHFFGGEARKLSLEEARGRIDEFRQVMETAFECRDRIKV